MFSIDDPQDPFKSLYDVDDENTVITFADWYHEWVTVASCSPVYTEACARFSRDIAQKHGPAEPDTILVGTDGYWF